MILTAQRPQAVDNRDVFRGNQVRVGNALPVLLPDGLVQLEAGSSDNIVQDRIARSRLAGDPPDAMISPRLHGINLFDFHRAAELIEHGRRAAEREIETIQQEIAVRQKIGQLHSEASA
jgi:predicted acylesterase/phospholipase RssA